MNTKHKADCKRVWKRYDLTCERCKELAAGAEPRRWNWTQRQDDAARAAEIRAHFASDGHRRGDCGPVCTFGEW